ncbi:MAG: hypothetical protein FWE85_02000 [Clostridiales bacterium]|nr:hypothetical protein [Clostridiales bacterium]
MNTKIQDGNKNNIQRVKKANAQRKETIIAAAKHITFLPAGCFLISFPEMKKKAKAMASTNDTETVVGPRLEAMRNHNKRLKPSHQTNEEAAARAIIKAPLLSKYPLLTI